MLFFEKRSILRVFDLKILRESDCLNSGPISFHFDRVRIKSVTVWVCSAFNEIKNILTAKSIKMGAGGWNGNFKIIWC